jgi:anti-sigma28 factor (negative regulator of flagellin synthesis)
MNQVEDRAVSKEKSDPAIPHIPVKPRQRRPRSLTTMKLEWVAERAVKVAQIKRAVDEGEYGVPVKELAKALLGS